MIDNQKEYEFFSAWARETVPSWTYEERSAAYQGWLAAKRDAAADLSASRDECERYRSENASLRNQAVMRFADMPGVQRGIQDYDNDHVVVIERHDFCSPQFRNVWIVPAGSFPHLEEGYAQQARTALEATK